MSYVTAGTENDASIDIYYEDHRSGLTRQTPPPRRKR
jgi:hypothetical protein